ncbi:MAG: hypothetical protein MR625_06670 [Clostridium sp.]|nr:hypothetical protein [Clostridium sp.]
MSKRRIIGIIVVLAVCGILALTGAYMDRRSITRIYDMDGNEIAQLYVEHDKIVYQCPEALNAYMDLVAEELEQTIEEKEQSLRGGKTVDGKKILAKKGFDVTVYYDSDADQVLHDQYTAQIPETITRFASVLCDTEGHVLACISAGDKNYVLEHTYAASTIKPLSVYGPAIESGVINWATMYEDSPIETVNGQEWPKNVEAYTYKPTTAAEGLQRSMNTIAVQVLQTYGAKNSADFLKEKFGIDVTEELQTIEASGENEVLGNIGLGYLRAGVTVKDMAGYYQVFANGGIYRPATALARVEYRGNLYMEPSEEGERVFSEDTAYIVNRMMKLVVQKGGTAEKANIEGYDICGKTGTSEDNSDHWFVGMTPEYVCATWYGGDSWEKEVSGIPAQYFASVIPKRPTDNTAAYPVAADVVSCDICKETGLVAAKSCDSFVGYFKDRVPEKACDESYHTSK